MVCLYPLLFLLSCLLEFLEALHCILFDGALGGRRRRRRLRHGVGQVRPRPHVLELGVNSRLKEYMSVLKLLLGVPPQPTQTSQYVRVHTHMSKHE